MGDYNNTTTPTRYSQNLIDRISCKASDVFTISAVNGTITNGELVVFIRVVDSNNAIINTGVIVNARTLSSPLTFTCGADGFLTFIFGCLQGQDTTRPITKDEIIGAKVMVNKGSTPTAYEPYTGNKILVNWEDEAGTVHNGTVTINSDRTGTLVIESGSRNLEDLVWSHHVSAGFNYARSASIRDIVKKPGSNSELLEGLIAEQATPIRSTAFNVYPYSVSVQANGDLVCNVNNSDVDIPSGKVVFPLAEPQIIDLTDEQISGILIALDGTNNIWANTGDVTVTYIAKSAKFSFSSPLRVYNYNNLKLFGNTYIEHGKG